jgi:phage terminase large subunit-like protein
MTSASGSRRQPIIWYFTTAGDDTSTLWISLRNEVCRMLEDCESGNPTKDHLFGYVACIDEDDDPFAFSEWCPELENMLRKANPNYPVTPKPQYIRQQWEDAKGNAIETNKFRRFHANQRVRSHLRPISPVSWQNLPKHDEIHPEWPAFGGIDAGRTDDFAAWAVCWKVEDRYRVIGQSYTCEERPKHLLTAQISEWISTGELTEHSGNSLSFDDFEADILAVPNVIQWAFDPTFLAQMAQHLEIQLGPDIPVKFYQSYRYFNEPLRKLLALVRDGRLEITDNRCHDWQAANLGVKSGAGGLWMPEKGEDLDQSSKIDWIVALTMALGLAILKEDEAQPTFSWG